MIKAEFVNIKSFNIIALQDNCKVYSVIFLGKLAADTNAWKPQRTL